jgi:hypothetical protein
VDVWPVLIPVFNSGPTALSLAVTIVAISVLEWQTQIQQTIILRDYESAGATTFLADAAVPENEIDDLERAVRELDVIAAVEAPYRGSDIDVIAETAFLVFENEKQQEYLGGRTAVLGASGGFDLARDYYERIGAAGEQPILGIPLIVTDGMARPPVAGEALIPKSVAEYVGVRPGVLAIVELAHGLEAGESFARRYELRVIGTFDAIGPDDGRFAPLWRLAARGRDVLTVRRRDARELRTTLPIVLNAELVRDFLGDVHRELRTQGSEAGEPSGRRQLVIRANSANDVTKTQTAVRQLLVTHGLREDCPRVTPGSFCLNLPTQNNFQTALSEQAKFGSGAGFFMALLLALGAIGNAGLQLQITISRWREHAILQALGFTPSQLLVRHILSLLLIFMMGVAVATAASVIVVPIFSGSFRSFATAAALCTATAMLGAVAVLIWPLRSHPGARIRELT